MTLVLAAIGRETIWLIADRRLSTKGRPPKDDGRKLMFVDATDGVAILGYAGLGATALGTEPADWMAAVLRGRNLPLEASLGVLAEAAKSQLPQHLVQLPGAGGPSHHIVVPAFVGAEARFYSIDLSLASDRKSYDFRWTRHAVGTSTRPPRLAIGGSGIQHLMRNDGWKRRLLRLVAAHDYDRLSARAVADHLANLNHEVHQGLLDQTVGPRSIVAWRYRKTGSRRGGGGHQFYTGATRDPNNPSLPTIATGMDMSAVVQAILPQMAKTLEALRTGQPAPEPNKDELNALLAKLPHKPDERLR